MPKHNMHSKRTYLSIIMLVFNPYCLMIIYADVLSDIQSDMYTLLKMKKHAVKNCIFDAKKSEK